MKYVVRLKQVKESTVVIEAETDEEADRLLLKGGWKPASERITSQDVYCGHEYVSHKTSDVVIMSEKDLQEYYDSHDMEKTVFKATECGCCYLAKEDYISVAGYAEGSDAECPEHRLYFPFTIEEWHDALRAADAEGCELCEECNTLD